MPLHTRCGGDALRCLHHQCTLFYLGYKNVTRAARHRFVCEWRASTRSGGSVRSGDWKGWGEDETDKADETYKTYGTYSFFSLCIAQPNNFEFYILNFEFTKKRRPQIVLRSPFLVELPGLEPRTTEPKSAVLPLHHSSIRCSKALQR